MTGKQLQKLLDRAGLSQREAARKLQVNERTIRRYVAGDAKVPMMVVFALQWLALPNDIRVEHVI